MEVKSAITWKLKWKICFMLTQTAEKKGFFSYFRNEVRMSQQRIAKLLLKEQITGIVRIQILYDLWKRSPVFTKGVYNSIR